MISLICGILRKNSHRKRDQTSCYQRWEVGVRTSGRRGSKCTDSSYE